MYIIKTIYTKLLEAKDMRSVTTYTLSMIKILPYKNQQLLH